MQRLAVDNKTELTLVVKIQDTPPIDYTDIN